MPNITVFDPSSHHIRLVGAMKTQAGMRYEFRAILDTGAPCTEFSDQFLSIMGLFEGSEAGPPVRHGLQTQKYAKLVLPEVEIMGHSIRDMSVFVSHYEKDWGVDVLIGLDFFRRFKVTIDYSRAEIISESFIH